MKGPQSFPHGLDFTNDVATYMGQSFRRKLDGSIGGPVKFPDYWSLEFLGECNLAVEKIVSAYRNKRETFIFLFSLLIISVTNSVAAVRLAASQLGQAAALGQLGSKWKAEPA